MTQRSNPFPDAHRSQNKRIKTDGRKHSDVGITRVEASLSGHLKSTTSIQYCHRPGLAVFGQRLAGQDLNCGSKHCLSDETSSPRWLKSVQITVRCADLLRSAGGCSLGSTAVDRAIRESAFPAAGRPAGSLRFSLRWLIRAVPCFRISVAAQSSGESCRRSPIAAKNTP